MASIGRNWAKKIEKKSKTATFKNERSVSLLNDLKLKQ